MVEVSTVNVAQVSVKIKMAWGNWCYCSRGGGKGGMAVFSALLVAALATVADGVAHERPAINMAAASAALGSGGGGGSRMSQTQRMPASRPSSPPRMAPAMMHRPAPMRHQPMRHQPMKQMKHKPVVHHMPKHAPTYKKDDHKYEWYKPVQKHAYVSHEDKSYGDDKHYETEDYKHETPKYDDHKYEWYKPVQKHAYVSH